ncbi:MAG: glycine cleavage system protein GcvH [Proteobacteria bacterium]|nr:glycine cleavage system protein GcvH [Pseudomonadota bacterium]MDA0971369.1 glycine cleavage system protein GcvH [Pseudomonadota bacterium]MDA0996092.1 glycine cleavage system protein GcvH [Pseudomonadota bacterium]
MPDIKYSKKHEWVLVEGNIGTVGITKYAAEQLGDIVFAEIPDLGKSITSGSEAAVVESVKAASDVYTPVSGEVTEGNAAIVTDPSLINKDPEGQGWFFKVKLSNPSELSLLMNKADYDKYVVENPS